MPKPKDQDDSDDYEDSDNEAEKVEIRKPKIERIDKFKNLKKIVINISMTQYPVVSEVAEELNWKIQSSNEAGDWDVYWTDFAIDPDVLIKMHLFQKINHYPGIHVIARKNLLGLNLMMMRNKFPEEYNFFPLTWMLPSQYAEFRAYYEDKPKGKTRTYIAKPEADCQGRGIFLTRKIEDLENGKHYVIQRYVARPFLIDGLKFDLRIYVLLAGTNPMRLYIYNEGLARLATETYTEPCNSNLEKQFIHLTNYAINKNNPKFIFNNNPNNMGVGHKRSLSCVYKQLAAKGVDIEVMKQKIRELTIKTVITGLPLMSHQYKCSQPEDYSGNMCFHIMGLDVMLNSKGEPLLIEVNHTPSFTTDTPLDYKIKFNLIKDTLALMNINVKKKTELYNRAKELNKDRLLTGKRQIFEGKEREETIKMAQHERDLYEDKHLGGFQKIFPLKDEQKMQRYNALIEAANRAYFEENGSIRMKMEEKEAKKLMRSDMKALKLLNKGSHKKSDLQGSTSAHTHEAEAKQKGEGQQTCLEQNQEREETQENDSGVENNEELSKSDNCLNSHSEMMIETQLIKNHSQRNPHQTKEAKAYQSALKKDQAIEVKLEHINQAQSRLKYPISSQANSIQPIPSQAKDPTAKEQKDFRVAAIRRREGSESEATPQLSKGKGQERVNTNHYSQSRTAKKLNGHHNIINNRILHHVQPNSELPNLMEPNLPDTPANQRKQDKSSQLERNQKSQPKPGKLYNHIARELRQMMDSKKGGNGGYVMPKIFCLNFQGERRFGPDQASYAPHMVKKNNIFGGMTNE